MIIFSTIVQSAEGSTYGIVPYVNPPVTGSIAGVVGAGGNVGAVRFGLGFRQMDTLSAFYLMAGCVLGSGTTGILGVFICIKGHSGPVFSPDRILRRLLLPIKRMPPPLLQRHLPFPSLMPMPPRMLRLIRKEAKGQSSTNSRKTPRRRRSLLRNKHFFEVDESITQAICVCTQFTHKSYF